MHPHSALTALAKVTTYIYMVFCQQVSLHPLPFSKQVRKFVAHLASEGLTHQTIKSYLRVIRHFHIIAGQGEPFPLLQYVLRGIKWSSTQALRQLCLPITPAILWLMKAQWATLAVTDPDYIMPWAACCLRFFRFMRAGEFTVTAVGDFDSASSLCVSVISVDSRENPTMVCVILRQTRQTHFGKESLAEDMGNCAQW